MLKDSNDYINIKNQIFKDLRNSHSSLVNEKENATAINFDSYYINLIVVPEEFECFEIMHILQYYQILFHLEEDNWLRSKFGFRDIRKDMGFSKEDKWPFLIVDSSTPSLPSTELQGKDSIIQYFKEINLMSDVMKHSGYEKQGLTFIIEKAIPAFDLLKSTLKGNIQFYLTTKNFRYARSTLQSKEVLRKFLWKVFKSFYYYSLNLPNRFSNNARIKERYQIFHDIIDEWETRLGKNNFHGGDEPDAADFKMYSLWNAHMHMFIMKNLLNARGKEDTKFKLWYQLMHQACQNTFS